MRVKLCLAACDLDTRSLLARKSSPALWKSDRNGTKLLPCRTLKGPRRSGLTLVTQMMHKEHMRIKKEIPKGL
jgi:hypothetical protein